MIIKKLAVSLVASLLMIGSASAAYIKFETRATNMGVNNADYLASWNAQTSSINSQYLTSFNNVKSGGNSHTHLQFTFDTAAPELVNFRIGLDAGFGGAIYLNGLEVAKNSNDMWWNYQWHRALSAGGPANPGVNSIDVYWAEGCCNGGQSAQIQFGDSQWRDLSGQLPPIAAPEPSVLTLLALGLLGTAGLRRLQDS